MRGTTGFAKSRRPGAGLCRVALPTAMLVASLGCIERTVTINTEPQGATVFLNDEEVGQSPVRIPFTWYGDYDVIARKKGYKTVHTNRRVNAPWYQWPGIDLITECFIPFTVHDDRVLETVVLAPQVHTSDEVLLQAADDMRQRMQNPEG